MTDDTARADEAAAVIIRDALYPEFHAAPAPEWALRAARNLRAARPSGLLREAAQNLVEDTCQRSWGSDGTLCATHWGRFEADADAK